MLCACLCFVCAKAWAVKKTNEEFVLAGDVTADGIVDVIDATEVQRISAGLRTYEQEDCVVFDCDDSGSVDIADATLIQFFAAGLTHAESLVGQYVSNPYFTFDATPGIPAYWENAVSRAESTFRILSPADESGSVSFVLFSDPHIGSGITNYAENTGVLARRVMDDLHIHYCVCLGDLNYRYPRATRAEVYRDIAACDTVLSPIRPNNLLIARGNHDYFFGTDIKYGKALSVDETNRVLFGRGRSDERRVFGAEGSYYYLDDVRSKTRLIVLNCVNSPYHVDADDAVDFDAYRKLGYGNQQLNWLADEALRLGDSWSAVIFQHYPPTWGYGKSPATGEGIRDLAVFEEIINAFCERRTCQGTYLHDAANGEGEWADVSVSADYSESEAEMIGVFCGHRHIDSIYTEPLRCPIMVICCAMSGSSATENPRVYGTAAETAMDVVTVNKEMRTVSLVCLGVTSTDSHDANAVRIVRY